MILAMREIIFFFNSYKKLGAFQMQNVFIVKLKNGKANPFSNINPNILGVFWELILILILISTTII